MFRKHLRLQLLLLLLHKLQHHKLPLRKPHDRRCHDLETILSAQVARFALALRDQINDLINDQEVHHPVDLVPVDPDLVEQALVDLDLADLVLEIILLVLLLAVGHVHNDLINDLVDRDLIADQ